MNKADQHLQRINHNISVYENGFLQHPEREKEIATKLKILYNCQNNLLQLLDNSK